MIEYILSAIVLGFVVAVPPGTVTIVACERSLRFGFRNSLCFAMGSSLTDVFYIVLVNLGVAHVISDNQWLKIVLWFFCGILLVVIGSLSIVPVVKKWTGREEVSNFHASGWTAFFSAILITLTNPMTIVGWLMVAGNFFLIWGEKFPASRTFGLFIVPFIMFGVLVWFIPLLFVVSIVRKKLNERARKWLVIISNICLIVFGFAAFYYAIKTLCDVLPPS